MAETPEEALARLEKGLRRGARFAVEGPDGRYSGSWLAWGNGNDYYIGARHALGSMKVSLHASGIGRVALHQSQIDAMVQRGLEVPRDRAYVKWRMPPPPKVGAACVATIKFPAAYLRGKPQTGKPNKPLLVFQLASVDHAAEIGFFHSSEPLETLEPKLETIGQPLLYTKLGNGSTVSIVARAVDFSPVELPTTEQLSRLKMHSTGEMEPADMSDLVAVFWNSPSDGGSLQMVEVGGIQVTKLGSDYIGAKLEPRDA